MATRTAATNRRTKTYRRGVLDSQPIPAPVLRSQNRIALKMESRFYVNLDGDDLAKWLNAASGTKSFDRIKAIMCEVRDLKAAFQSNAGRFLMPGPVHPATQEQRNLRDENAKISRALDVRLGALDKALTRYVFRPRAYWYWADREWLLNLYADELRNEFFVQPDNRTRQYGEADAVMSILRLTAKGHLDKIRLCPTCKKHWRYAAKSHYKFCSAECRGQFY